MAQFSDREVQQVLSDLRRRFPASTEADALTILQDAEWAHEDEQAFFARDEAECRAELEFAALEA